MARIDVVHMHDHLDIASGIFEAIGESKNGIIVFLNSIIQHDKPWGGNFYERRGQQSGGVLGIVEVFLQSVRRIKKAAERHVGVPSALLFVHIEVAGKEERDIILHTHVDNVLDGVELKIIRVVIIRLVNGIVQLEGQAFPLFGTEERIEQSVLVASVNFVFCLFLHGVSLPQRNQRESVLSREL